MALVRPDAAEALWRWRDVLIGGVLTGLGLLWLPRYGLYVWAGALSLGLGLFLLATGLQRARFRRAEGAPGVVQVDERQLSYFGPLEGGAMALDQIARIALIPEGRPLHWRFEGQGGDILHIPVSAAGSEGLFDVFATLPGLRMERVLHLLATPPDGPSVIWQRGAGGTGGTS